MHLRVAAVAVLLVLVPVDAYAYLDPGTGSLILQGLLAALFGAAYTIKTYWSRLKGIFQRQAATTQPPAAPVDEEP